MKIIQNTYKHVVEGFSVKVKTCNSKVAKTENIETGEEVNFNRQKFEFMIKKGVFVEVA